MYVDLQNWKYYKDNLDETIKSLITNKLSLSALDLIKFETSIKNSKIPYLTFDEIKLEI